MSDDQPLATISLTARDPTRPAKSSIESGAVPGAIPMSLPALLQNRIARGQSATEERQKKTKTKDSLVPGAAGGKRRRRRNENGASLAFDSLEHCRTNNG